MKATNLFILMIFILTLQESEAQQSLPTRKLSLFKNGTALFIKEGTKNISKGELKLPIPQQALNGTYWIGVNKDNTIKSVWFKNDTIKANKQINDLYDLLVANKNKTVVLHTSPTQGLDKTYTGVLLDYNREHNTVRIQTDKRIAAIQANHIYEVNYDGSDLKNYEEDSITRMMVVKFEKEAPSAFLQEYYMQSGLSWMPSYFLKLKDEKTARLELKAMIENFAEDIKDVETELVVGAPQMYYGAKLDPMTYDYYSGSDGIDNNDRSKLNSLYSNVMQTRSAVAFEASGDGFSENFETEGEKNNDMYIYKLGKISLQKNSKGNFPIQANIIEYKDKYEANIYDHINYYNSRFCDETEQNIDAYHSLELKNTGTTPLTTAPVFVVNEKDQFLAQDQLKYTPSGSTVSIQLSKALDIIIKNNEEEVSRTDEVKKVGKQMYSKVVLKGTITINNFQEKEITLTIKKNVNGSLTLVDEGGTSTKKSTYNYLNPNTEIKWDLKLGANQKKVISYQYEVYFVM